MRILSVLAPRIFQVLEWTVEPTKLAEPLLSKDEILSYKENASDSIQRLKRITVSKLPIPIPKIERLKPIF